MAQEEKLETYRATTKNWSICLFVSGHSGSHILTSILDWSLSSGSPIVKFDFVRTGCVKPYDKYAINNPVK